MPKPNELGKSLRHYLIVQRRIQRSLGGPIVLAEEANQLFRDTEYGDLITFEEDIARIAAVVMVIAESAGSLAELGAFATNDTIRSALLVLGQSKFSSDESFVRFGPMERVKKYDDTRLAFYPWRVRGDGQIIKASISGHYSRIGQLINKQLSRVPNEQLYRTATGGLGAFVEILWILHICSAMPVSELHSFRQSLFAENIEQREIKNKLYCMKLAGWVSSYSYENKEYWYTKSIEDPFRYRFRQGVNANDSTRRKVEAMAAAKSALKVPKHVLRIVADAKSVIVK